MRRPTQIRISGAHLVGLLLLVWTALPVRAQTTSDSQACKGSTVDLEGTAFAQKSRAFLMQLQSVVKTDDKAKLAAMISYPLLVIHGGRKTHIKTKAEFLSQYETIFDGPVRRAIAQQSAKCLFGNYQGAMIGDGEVWFREQPNGTMKIITVNLGTGRQ
ncbi:MAG: hypothetical protein ABR902_18840 [Candidatus Korobacteraceae bacterium]|jgi:hypothetical protein